MGIILVSLGGFFGAISRYYVGQSCRRFQKVDFPFGTFIVNILGSFLLGVVIGCELTDSIYLLVATGFLGAFTTFSTFTLELTELMEKDWKKTTIVYLSLTLVFGFLFFFTGFLIGQIIHLNVFRLFQ